MYGVQDKINQILRGAETICKNNMTREIYDRFSSISCTPSHINKLYQELKASQAEVERLRDSLHDCLSFLALHGAVGATPDTARLLQKRILATLTPTDK